MQSKNRSNVTFFCQNDNGNKFPDVHISKLAVILDLLNVIQKMICALMIMYSHSVLFKCCITVQENTINHISYYVSALCKR